MREDKIRLLYDGTILADGFGKGSNRSGLFMVVYHIFCELLKDPDLEVILYADPACVEAVRNFLRTDEFLRTRDIPIFNDLLNSESNIWGMGTLNRAIDSVSAKKNRLCFEHKCLRCQALRGVVLGLKVIRRILRTTAVVFGGPRNPWDTIQAAFSPALPHLPEVARRPKIKRYIILYDAIPYIFPDLFPDTREGCSWNLNLLGLLGADDVCFAISEQTKKDFLYFSRLFRENHSDFLEMFTVRENCNSYTSHVVSALQTKKSQNQPTGLLGSGTMLRPENIEVALLAAADRFRHSDSAESRDAVLRKYKVPVGGQYIFTLCTLEKRKNIVYAIRNFLKFVERKNRKDLYLVLGGGSWYTYEEELNALLSDPVAKQQVFRIGYMDDADVPVLFSHALCTIYPSLYEGFGLPVLEAMQCGCPVIASDSSAIPEVLGDAGILIDVASDRSLQDALERLYADPELRREYSRKGMERAKRFSWEKAASVITGRILRDFNRKRGSDV